MTSIVCISKTVNQSEEVRTIKQIIMSSLDGNINICIIIHEGNNT